MMATSSALRARVSPTVSTRRASPPPSARVAAPRAAAAAVATTTSPVVARAAALLGDDLSVLSAAVEAAELVDALTTGEPKTVFAPSDAAFAKACEELQLSKEEILQLPNLVDILTHHVVPGAVAGEDLVDGQLASLNENFPLTITGLTCKERPPCECFNVSGACISETDRVVGDLTIHVVDEVIFPPWSAPAKVLTPQQVLAFEGWAPEVINGRLAMLGFLTAVVQEVATGHSFATQLGENFGVFAAQVQLWAFASLVPSFSSNEGYTADPFTMEGSKTWREVFKGSPWTEEARKIFSPQVEQLNGRAAMVGIVSLIAVEAFRGGEALF